MKQVTQILALMALIVAQPAFAVYQTCTSEGGKVKLEIDLETHSMTDDGSEFEVHTYIDSIDYGSGNILKSSISQETHAYASRPWVQEFEQGIKLQPADDQKGCDITYLFEQESKLTRTKICCTVQ